MRGGRQTLRIPRSGRRLLRLFRESQRDVLSNGIRIDLRERKGRKVLMQVGGRLEGATIVRSFE